MRSRATSVDNADGTPHEEHATTGGPAEGVSLAAGVLAGGGDVGAAAPAVDAAPRTQEKRVGPFT
ncbi:hypothetical protein R3Q06_30560 [Rhodococcus erythropolis]|uniref:hypothetical protein n=1 Tax=Rhodococcus erythropolis TaxID=1833 RepID=UPI00294A3C74|nr:hypothetical protein [Rhodococcus erythropolis]MDV6277838.1 hypothetical protein [Rhodococcus erythropolis]